MLLRLREELQRRSRASGAARTARTALTSRAPLDRLRQLDGAKSGIDEDDRRSFVQALLTEEFGDAVSQSATFERIAADVWSILNADDKTRILIDQAIASLRSPGS